MKVTCNTKPDAIQYMPLPNGEADVWLRKNIQEDTDTENGSMWTADETYFRTNLGKEEIVERFEELYANARQIGDSVPDADDVEISAEEALDIIMGVMI